MKRKRSPNSRITWTAITRWPAARRRAAAKALAEARELLKSSGDIAKGELAWSDDGREVSPLSTAAHTWCSQGAICRVTFSLPYGARRPMKQSARDALIVLGKMHDAGVRDLGEAATAVYELNDGHDLGQVEAFKRMNYKTHFAHVLETFEKAEKALR